MTSWWMKWLNGISKQILMSKSISLKKRFRRKMVSRRQGQLREYRFASAVPTASGSSYGSYDSWCPFLIAWFRTPSSKQAFADPRRCLEATKLCIRFCTKDSFLYYVLNKALREEDHSKLETLGPCCFLLRNYVRFSQDYIGTVYRGISMANDEVGEYNKAIGQWKTWSTFTSTSKDREMAKAFGNTLTIIEISPSEYTPPRSFDIAHMSDYPWEQETLIPAGVAFQTIAVEKTSLKESITRVRLWWFNGQ